MSEKGKVTFDVTLDLKKIEQHSLDWWAAKLDIEQMIGSEELTWSLVHQTLARVLVGSEHYQMYSIMAIDHQSHLGQYGTVEVRSGREPIKVTQNLTPPPAPPTQRKRGANG